LCLGHLDDLADRVVVDKDLVVHEEAVVLEEAVLFGVNSLYLK
jgi:hypothetical protein